MSKEKEAADSWFTICGLFSSGKNSLSLGGLIKYSCFLCDICMANFLSSLGTTYAFSAACVSGIFRKSQEYWQSMHFIELPKIEQEVAFLILKPHTTEASIKPLHFLPPNFS